MITVRKIIAKQQGLTLIEIMISLALGLLLSAALLQVLTSTGKISGVEGALSSMQETGRYALDTVMKDLRVAGYGGCMDTQKDSDPTNTTNVDVIADALAGSVYEAPGVFGYEVNTAGVFDPPVVAAPMNAIQTGGTATVKARPGTDVLSVNFASQTSANVVSNAAGGNAVVDGNPWDAEAGDFMFITNCTKAHLFELTSIGASGGNFSLAHVTGSNNADGNNGVFIPNYDSSGGKVRLWEMRTYFVGDTGRTTANGDPVYALYQRIYDEPAQELLEGVENLQVEYGMQVVGGNGRTRYVSANDPDLDFGYVINVRVGLLVHSVEQVADILDQNTYSLPGGVDIIPGDGLTANTHATDRALRKAFIATVQLRNRRALD